jgi:serine/threonine protein kinase/Tol biopolymer transport system component
MGLSAGTKLGAYQIVGVLGAGGMGEVYRAHDTTLNRNVALKVLPEAFTLDLDRLARFKREAQMLAALNHPNIAAIYGFESSAGVQALVLELVEGPTLAERIALGTVPLDEALPIARQIAEALEAAHEQGIVHRDLKPSNIKVRADGTVKVLDFGLAKAIEGAGRAGQAGRAGWDATHSPTITTPAVTGIGVILGTAAYMSPEQAKGHAADKRSDVWAFGCVVFEMLTGKRAFEGEDVSDTLAAVLKDEPAWQRLPPSTPEHLQVLLRRCLQKDRKKRLRDIGDARLEIDAAHSSSQTDERGVHRSRRIERLVLIAALAIVTLIAAWALARVWRPLSPGPEMRVDIDTPPTRDPVSLAISPDGRSVVFAATTEGRSRLWLRPLDATAARPLTGTDDARFPFWSPDSRYVGFFANDDKLKRIDVDGATIETLANAPVGSGGAWNRDGTVLYAPVPDAPILRVSASGGPSTFVVNRAAVTRLEAPRQTGHRFPQLLPNGRHFLYYAAGSADVRGVYVSQLDGSLSRRLLDADAPAVYAPAVAASTGQLLFVRQSALWAQDFDAGKLALSGTPFHVAEQIAVDTGRNVAALSASAAGSIVYRTGSTAGGSQLTWFDRSGKELGKAGGPADLGVAFNPGLSPDGRFVALSRSVNGNTDIWRLDIDRNVLARFTSEAVPEIYPIWSPDGQRIVYSSPTAGKQGFDLYVKSVNSTAPGTLLLKVDTVAVSTDWSPDGKVLLYRLLDPKTATDIWALPLEGDRRPFPVVQTGFEERDGQFSPDGKWIAYQSNESGRFEVYVQPFPGPGGKTQVSIDGGAQPRWQRDGRELFYIALDGHLHSVPMRFASNGTTLQVGTPGRLFMTHVGAVVQGGSSQAYVVSRDGQRFLMNTVAEVASGSPITMILNWRGRQN